ncbi:MAG TPA: VWA domain-containing protein, partial [Polyangia bacterium]|nr:VWA domain-containing protein [Polyangia bacterium]
MAPSPLSMEVFPLHPAIAPGEAGTEFVLVRVRAEKVASGPRPRLTAVLVLDVSGSMRGEPLDQVIASTQRLAEILGDDDSLGVVAFASGARTVSPIRKLDGAARREVHAEVAALASADSTNISGGLAHAALLFPARTGGERHLALLLSDGQPNVGADTPDALAAEVRLVKARQIAVSSLGFGAAHNEDVLIAIADAGGGRYAFVDDPKLASSSFARALGAQRDVVAEELELTLTPGAGVEIARVLGDPPTRFGAGGLKVTLADAIAGDELNIVVELKIAAPRESGAWRALGVKLDGKRIGERAPIACAGDAAIRVSPSGPFPADATAQVAVAVARADDLRTEARALADRRNFQGAAAILARAKRLIE